MPDKCGAERGGENIWQRANRSQEAVKALKSVDLGKVAESLPFKLPFGR